jgi:hypothetical protein
MGHLDPAQAAAANSAEEIQLTLSTPPPLSALRATTRS